MATIERGERKDSVDSLGQALPDEGKALTVIVVGASGDLAKKKTYPSLFELYCNGFLPAHINIVGFARSNLTEEAFRESIHPFFKGRGSECDAGVFLAKCHYVSGQYNSDEDFARLSQVLSELEAQTGRTEANRLFYLAIPPSVFLDSSRSIKHAAMSPSGDTRIIIEKPFGRDSASSRELSSQIKELFDEHQIYRIDHYLGKEMVQNLIVLRFANCVFEPVWNRFYVKNIQITFKEPIGTDGRGGYFDQFGIIRDVLQNHLIQIMTLIAMEPPVSLRADDVRDEKVKVLRSTEPLQLENIVIGQYGKSEDGSLPAYIDDPTVPDDSICPTFATAVLYVNNPRWDGVPFILKAGKALNERKAEIRVQFENVSNMMFREAGRNELVIRVQPDEAVYLKTTVKVPGLTERTAQSELDLSYKSRYSGLKLPDAYERLLLDVMRGDQNLFVRDDELQAAWDIFTPVLHQLETERILPHIYTRGTRGPLESDELIKQAGYSRHHDYHWPGHEQ